MEEWRDVKGYKGKYMVSNIGRVKSLNYRNTGKEGIMKPQDNGHGYLQVELCKDGKREQPLVHVLVATAFLENPDNLPEVNHKDEDKANNCVENLEWCDRAYNLNYGTRNKRISEKMTNNPKRGKPVIGINKVSGLIMEFPSLMEAERQTGISNSNICACLNGRYKSAGGYTWQYSDSEEVANEQE